MPGVLTAIWAALGFSEFIILYHLSLAHDEKSRGVDLAEKTGLTASGVTRVVLPMEKIGLVKREPDKQDARVSCVVLTTAGKRKLNEALERAEIFCEDIFPASHNKKIRILFEQLNLLSRLVK